MIAYPKSFEGQFIIGPRGAVARAGAAVHDLNALSVQIFGDLPLTRVHDGDDRLIGALLGYPVDYRGGRVVRDVLRLAGRCGEGGDIDLFLEDAIYRLGGSYIFVLDDGARRAVYLDAAGSMSAVYDQAQGLCAATTGLLLNEDEYQTRFRAEKYDHLRVDDEGWFSGGLTAHRGIERILCNHCLDLDSGLQRRHWPKAQVPLAVDPDEACRTINRIIAQHLKTLMADGSVVSTLTAGNETRLVLGACREFKDSMQFVTLKDDQNAHLDALRADELARRFDLNHWTLPIVYADDDAVAQWRALCSHCIGGANMRTFPSIYPLYKYDYFTGGLGGEIGRAFLWRPTDTDDFELTPRNVTARLGMPFDAETLQAVEAWFERMPPVDTFLALDLAYMELRLGCWGFTQAYASPGIVELHPMMCRESYVAMLSLPPEWRRTNRMITRCIELSWPELLELPINRYGDYRDLMRPLMRASRNPHLILKKLRKRFG